MANHTKVEPDTWESVLSAETIHEAYGEPSDSTPASVVAHKNVSTTFYLNKDAGWGEEREERRGEESENEEGESVHGSVHGSVHDAEVRQKIYSWPTLKSMEGNPQLQNAKSKVTFAEIVQMVLLNQYCGGSTRFCGTADNTKFLDTAATFLDVRPDATGQPRHLSIDIVTSRYVWALKYMF